MMMWGDFLPQLRLGTRGFARRNPREANEAKKTAEGGAILVMTEDCSTSNASREDTVTRHHPIWILELET
jgi:hypothetical protein